MQFLPTDLNHLNTLQLPARANFAELTQLSQANDLLALHQPLFFLGGGSNVVMQEDIASHVVKVGLKGKGLLRETSSHYFVQACAGENWHDFVQYCLANSWPGLENLALIPGTVGAAPVQNIGAYGVELEQLVDTVYALNLLDGKTYTLQNSDCNFSYRDSCFKQAGPGVWLILKVVFKLPKKWQAQLAYPDLQRHKLLQSKQVTAQQIFTAVCDIRSNKLPDPLLLPNAGSFFKNPIVDLQFAQNLQLRYPQLKYFSVDSKRVKIAAGWLIDHAGWRGKRLGPVGMHTKQALVLVNYAAATASDVLALADKIKDDIKAKFDIVLEQEPLILA